jgi:hypothetical protein
MFACARCKYGIRDNAVFSMQSLHHILIKCVENSAFIKLLSIPNVTNNSATDLCFINVHGLDVVVPSVLTDRQPTVSNCTCYGEELVSSLELLALFLMFFALTLLASVIAVKRENWTSTGA